MSGWFGVLVRFSEPVKGFETSDIEVTNGSVASISRTFQHNKHGNTEWYAKIAPASGLNGDVFVKVPAAAATDVFGNANTASETFVVAARGATTLGRKAFVNCAIPPDQASWERSAGGHGQRLNNVSVRVGFGQANGSAPSDLHPDDITLTAEDGVSAGAFLGVCSSGPGNSKACTFGATTHEGVSGTLTLQVLAGAITDLTGGPSLPSDPMYVAGDNWTVSVADASATEGTDATLDFVVSLNARDDCREVTVNYATADGTATAGEDYTAVSGALTFAPGETTKTVSVAVLDDAVSDSGETLTLQLSNVSGHLVALGAAEATGTIRDPDVEAPTLSSASVDGAELTLTFSKALNESSQPPASSFAVTVGGSARTVDAAAVSGSTVVLTLSSAVVSGETVTVGYTVPTGDSAKSVQDTAGNPAAAFANTQVTNEMAALPVVSIAPSTTPVAEGTAASFTLAHTGATDAALTVAVAVSETGAAVSGTAPTSVTFAAESSTATLSVATEDDEVAEDASTLTATVSSGTGYTVDGTSGSAEVVVNDDDASPAVTARFENVPESHDGATAFTVELHFSENIPGLSYTTVAGGLLDVPGANVTGARRLTAGSNQDWLVTVAPGGSDDIAISLPARACGETAAICIADNRPLSEGISATVQMEPQAAQPPGAPLTARFENVPESHDGATAFTVELHFSENIPGLSYTTVGGGLLDAPGANVTGARRLTAGSNQGWLVTVAPAFADDVTLTVPGTDDCEAPRAICVGADRKLEAGASATITGIPIGVTVADTEVEEAEGATLDFVVSMNRAAAHDIQIWYRAYDGTATAGADYVAVYSSFTMTAGETTKTVSVSVLDDAHDEGAETVKFWLSGVRGLSASQLTDPYAVGTIRNSDPMPKAWITRFGRTVGSQVVDAVTARFEGGTSAHVTVGGMSLDGTSLAGADPSRWPEWASESEQRGGTRTMTERELLLGSSFHLSAGERDGGGPAFAAWGRVATGGFEADVDDVRMDGDVTTGLIGLDAEWERMLAGLVLSQSKGDGSYMLSEEMGDDRGTVESTLTGVYPYARLEMSERVSAWGLAGLGTGELTLNQEGQAPIDTDLSMTMGAVGVKGTVLDGTGASGVGLNVKSDAMWVRTASDRTAGLESAEGDVSRLRLILEGERVFEAGDGSTFTPTGQVGLRLDGGDAETGTGVEVGAGIRYTVGALTIEGQVRALVAHEESGYEEWGASGALRVNPSPSGRGLSLTLAPVWGNAANGAERLWSGRDATAFAVGEDAEAEGRLDAELGYGLGLGRMPGVLTPYAGLSFADGGGRSWRSGTRWTIAPGAALGLEATRAEAANDDAVEHGVMLRGSFRW